MVDGKMKFLRPDVAGGDARDARFGLVGDMSNALRARARFAFVVDGYGAPKDLMRALGEGFCVLRVKSASGYRGWFEHALVEGTH